VTESPQAGQDTQAAGSTDRGQQDADQTEISRTVTGKPKASRAAAGKTKTGNAATSKAAAGTTAAETTAAGTAADSNTEVSNTAALLTKAKAALEQFIDVKVDDDGALSFQHAGVPGAVQAVQLAEGLVLLSLTCVVAWDVPAGGVRSAGSAGGGGFAGSASGGGSAGSASGRRFAGSAGGGDDLAARLAMRAGEGLFGTLGVVPTQAGYDVTLRYAFPAAGLQPVALGTLLMLVISTASQLRSELLPA